MKSNTYGIVFIALAVISFLILTVVCPMYAVPQPSEGTAGNLTCTNIPFIEIILPVIFILIAVYFFWKATKKRIVNSANTISKKTP